MAKLAVTTTATAVSTIHPRLTRVASEIPFTGRPFDDQALRPPSAGDRALRRARSMVPTVRYWSVLHKRRDRTLSEASSGGPREAGDDELVDQRLHGTAGGRTVRDDGSEDQIPRQQVPQLFGDGGLRNLAPVDGLLKHLSDHGFALIDEVVLQGVVERGMARRLDENGAHRAGVPTGLKANELTEFEEIAPQGAGVRRLRDLADPFGECGQHEFG